MAVLFFSQSFLQELILHAEFGKHLLQTLVLVIDGLHLRDQRRVHAAILRAPLIERRTAHAVLPTKLGHRNAALSLLQNCKDLRLAESSNSRLEPPRSFCRENSTFEPR